MVNIKLVAYDETPEFKQLGLSRLDAARLQQLIDDDYTHYVLENVTHSDGQHLYFSLMVYKTEASALLYYGIVSKQPHESVAGSLGDGIVRRMAAEPEIKIYYKARSKQRALARFIDRLA